MKCIVILDTVDKEWKAYEKNRLKNNEDGI